MIAILPLLLLTGLGNFIGTPPRDLASLLEPKIALEKLQAKTDGASLIGYLTDKKTHTVVPFSADVYKKLIQELGAESFKTRRAAEKQLEAQGAIAVPHLKNALSNKDPEIKMSAQKLLNKVQADADAAADESSKLYVRNLMAIRMLADMKAAKAVPTLKAFAKTASPTLADAALNAIKVIEGKPEVRPLAKEAMLDVMSRIPLDTSFVVALDMTTGAKTVRAVEMMKAMANDPAMAGGMLPPNAMQQIEPEIIKGIMTALQTVGNVRLDAAFMTFSGTFGVDKGNQYMGFILKGLYDPKRMEAAIMKQGRMQAIKMHGRTVYHDSGEEAFCCLDKHTLLISVSPDRPENPVHMEPLILAFSKVITDDDRALEAIAKRLPKLAPAVTDLLAGKARIGIAGSLSDVQRAEARANTAKELDRVKDRLKTNPNPEKQFEKTALEMVVEVIEADAYQGSLSAKSGMELKAICTSPEKAVALEKSVSAFDKGIREMMMKVKAQFAGNENMPPQFAKMFEMITVDKPMFPTKRADKAVSIEVDLKQWSNLLPSMFFGLGMRAH